MNSTFEKDKVFCGNDVNTILFKASKMFKGVIVTEFVICCMTDISELPVLRLYNKDLQWHFCNCCVSTSINFSS